MGHQQRKLCLTAAIVVVRSPAVQLADRQRAVASFQSASLTDDRLMPRISVYLSDNTHTSINNTYFVVLF